MRILAVIVVVHFYSHLRWAADISDNEGESPSLCSFGEAGKKRTKINRNNALDLYLGQLNAASFN